VAINKYFNVKNGLTTGNITLDAANSDITANNFSGNDANLNGNLTVNGISNLNNISNVKIYGGLSGQYLKTDGNGNLSWQTGSGGNGSPGGNNTQVQFNDNGNFGASANLTFDYNTNTFTTIGTLSLPLETPIQFGDNGAGNYVALQGPPTINANVTWNLPNSDGGNGTFLATDGAGNMYWSQVKTGNITVIGRSGNISIPLYNGALIVVGRSGNIPVPI